MTATKKKKNPTASLIHNSERLNVFLPKDPPRMSTLTFPIQHHAGSPDQCNKSIKGNKIHTGWKRRNKTIPIHQCHNFPLRKSQEIHKNNYKI